MTSRTAAQTDTWPTNVHSCAACAGRPAGGMREGSTRAATAVSTPTTARVAAAARARVRESR